MPVGFICCSMGASIWPMGVAITWRGTVTQLVINPGEFTSLGMSRMCWGIPLPVRNWAVSWEKLLQLCWSRSYLMDPS